MRALAANPRLRPALRAVEAPSPFPRDHFSYSQVERYERCPEQYRLHYVVGLRPRRQSAALVFGSAIHETLAAHFTEAIDPVDFFSTEWGLHHDDDLRFPGKDTWESLQAKGEGLFANFLAEHRPQIGAISSVEASFSLRVNSLQLPLVGKIDLVAELDGILTVIDWKTSSSTYPEHEAHLADQLTAYALARPDVPAVAFGVFVKTKEPKFEWHRSKRVASDITSFVQKVEQVSSDIAHARFEKRPGDHCGWCDYLPLCLGRMAEAKKTLIVPA